MTWTWTLTCQIIAADTLDPGRQRLGPLGMSSIKIKRHIFLTFHSFLLLQRCLVSRCHDEILRAFLCVSFDRTLFDNAFYVVPLQAKPGQEPFCTEKGPILFYSTM